MLILKTPLGGVDAHRIALSVLIDESDFAPKHCEGPVDEGGAQVLVQQLVGDRAFEALVRLELEHVRKKPAVGASSAQPYVVHGVIQAGLKVYDHDLVDVVVVEGVGEVGETVVVLQIQLGHGLLNERGVEAAVRVRVLGPVAEGSVASGGADAADASTSGSGGGVFRKRSHVQDVAIGKIRGSFGNLSSDDFVMMILTGNDIALKQQRLLMMTSLQVFWSADFTWNQELSLATQRCVSPETKFSLAKFPFVLNLLNLRCLLVQLWTYKK